MNWALMVYDLLLLAEFTNDYLFLFASQARLVSILASEMRDSAGDSQGIFHLDSRRTSPRSAGEGRVFQSVNWDEK